MVSRLLVLSCLAIAGCAKPPVNILCEPIFISKDDRLTKGTAEQILTQNESIEASNE